MSGRNVKHSIKHIVALFLTLVPLFAYCLSGDTSCSVIVSPFPAVVPSCAPEAYGTPGEPVDLGLSVYWSDRNIGADGPASVGKFFGYGDATGNETSSAYKNYVSQDIIGTDHDPAYVFWGEGWRMPTTYELDELCEMCDWIWTKRSGVEGFKVVGRGGDAIFLPVTGQRSDTTIHFAKTRGYYWTGEIDHVNSNYASALFFYKDNHYVKDYRKVYGFCIRPVRDYY